MTSTDLDQLLSTTPARSPGRCCFLLQVRPEKLTDYVAAHQEVWEEMREALTEAGWRNYSLFLRREDGLVVGYFEADDSGAAQEAMSRAAISPRWEVEVLLEDLHFTAGRGEKPVREQHLHLP